MKLHPVRFTHLSRFWVLVLISALLATVPAHAQKALGEDVLLKAMQDELARSVAQLQLEKLEKPYYIEYAVLDTETFEAQAAFGALVRSNRDRGRLLRVEVRVGSYELDNSEFISQRSLFTMGTAFPRQLVEEDDYIALRRDLWLATDAVYKQALEQVSAKRAFIQNKVQPELIPDFSREEATTAIVPRQGFDFDQAKWQEVVRRLSALFREFPAIQDSSVSLRVQLVHKYFVNSEGTVVLQPALLVWLQARAATQAPDGMPLKHFVVFSGMRPDQLPSEPEMAAAIRGMAQELTALASAPILENYVGPVLLVGQAAGELFAQVLAPQLSGHRPPLLEQAQLATLQARSELADRLNRPVLPPFFTVVDDPTQTTYNQQPLIGAYQVDDQGVKAQAVVLIENGVLKTLLMSRRPRKEIAQSNGHGRAMLFGSPSAQIGNLFIRAKDGKSLTELKQQLIALCKAQGLSYGLLIKVLDNPAITDREVSVSSLVSLVTGGGQVREPLTPPILAYKVYVEDGREELVRGLTVGEMSVRRLKEIAAAGSDASVTNRLAASGGGVSGLMMGIVVGVGESAAGGIPTTIVAPSVLFEELEFKRVSGPQQKPALLPHPFFSR